MSGNKRRSQGQSVPIEAAHPSNSRGPIYSQDISYAPGPGTMNSGMPSNMSQPTSFAGLLLRHMQNDLNAYGYDRDYCTQQLLEEQGLTPQEARTLRLRVFDLNHQIRLCQHKMEILTALGSIEQPAPSPQTIISSLSAVTHPSPANSGQLIGVGAPDNPSMSLMHQAAQSTAQAVGPTPAKRAVKPSQTPNGHPSAKRAKKEVSIAPGDEENAGNMIQRLGFWKCRLCTSPKYLAAPQPKQPSAPCKWPLRDIAKMITHFTDMHSEHSPSERCEELGTALDSNRGPFEYWLNRSRSMDVGDGAVMRECIVILQSGRLPPLLRRLSRAAAAFPEEEEE